MTKTMLLVLLALAACSKAPSAQSQAKPAKPSAPDPAAAPAIMVQQAKDVAAAAAANLSEKDADMKKDE